MSPTIAAVVVDPPVEAAGVTLVVVVGISLSSSSSSASGKDIFTSDVLLDSGDMVGSLGGADGRGSML